MHAFARRETLQGGQAARHFDDDGFAVEHADFAVQHPASVAVEREAAERLISIMEHAGDELLTALRDARIIPLSSSSPVDLRRLRDVVSRFDVVIVGELAARINRDARRNIACSCLRQRLRGECAHDIFVESLTIQGVR